MTDLHGLQARASRLSFADVLKRLAALPPNDPVFVSKQVLPALQPANYHCASLMVGADTCLPLPVSRHLTLHALLGHE